MRPLLILRLLLSILLADAEYFPCGQSRIESYSEMQSTFDTLKCEAREDSLMAIEYNWRRYVSFTCDWRNGWKIPEQPGSWRDEYRSEEYISGSPTLKCVEYCAFTGNRIHVDKGHYGADDRVEVHCSSPQYLYYGAIRMLSSASCTLQNGWVSRDEQYQDITLPIDTSTPAHFECANKCNRRFIIVYNSAPIYFDEDTNTLTCVGGETSLMAIELNRKRYVSLVCDEWSGWKAKIRAEDERENGGVRTEEYRVADNDKPLAIACVEYCASRGVGLHVQKRAGFEANDMVEVNCTRNMPAKLFHNRTYIRTEAYCMLHFGWAYTAGKDDKHGVVLRDDSSTPAAFECRKHKSSAKATTPRSVWRQEEEPTGNAKSVAQTLLIVIVCSIGAIIFM